ncbi:MAG: hypothetical protein L3J34_11395 [Flavobacteriaceae bacterium]|nr:hypothetical protein [Flavobacteriaceae bacterium]
MKKLFYFGLIMLLSITLFSACSTDDDGSSNNSLQIAQVQSVVESGTWRITNFNDSGQDETSDFTGYNFTFATDGTLTASNGTTTLNGTWLVTNDSSDDNDDIEFNIFFSVPTSNNFEDLNDDWDIGSTSASRIELIDDSDYNSSTDRLTFEKN